MLLNDIFESGFKDQVKGTEKAKTVKPNLHTGSQPHPFQGRLVGGESANPAQQAAIAIAKKKDKGVVEDENPTDKITMDIPLFIRMMEYAREDAKDDMDLHSVTDRAIELMKEHEYLCMDNYNSIVGTQGSVDEAKIEEGLLGKVAGLIGAYYGVQLGVPDAIMNTMDMPLGTYEMVQHLLGAGAGYVAGAAAGDAVASGTKKLIAKMLWTGIKKTIQSIKGGTPKEQAWKQYETEVQAQYEKIKQAASTGGKAEPKLFDKSPVKTEGKIKGKDGKACWKGYRYAGTEYGKDKCVPVKKGK